MTGDSTDVRYDPTLAAEQPLLVTAQFAVIAALVLLPLFYVVLPPLQDYPNHLARMHAITVCRATAYPRVKATPRFTRGV